VTEQRGWLEKLLKGSKRAKRQAPEQFAAYRWSNFALKQEPVRDISSSGVFIVTEQHWPLDTPISIVLQREGQLEMHPDHRITMHAKVARHGKDGVGLAFILPTGQEALKWDSLEKSIIEQAAPKEMTGLVKMIQAVGFLSRICPLGVDEISRLIRSRLSNNKVISAVGIALHAENVLSSSLASDKKIANPRLAVRVLEEGSRAEEGHLQHLWGGLLIASCSAEGNDESNRPFVELFAQLSTVSGRILELVCTRSTKFLAQDGSIAAQPLACNIEEVRVSTGSRGIQIEHEFGRLSGLRLLDKRSPGSLALLPSDETYLTVTSHGLELFARCNGHQGPPQTFYKLGAPGTLGSA
jgi:hypothetical protein